MPRIAERMSSRNRAGKSGGMGRARTSASGDALLEVKQCGALATRVAAIVAGWGPATTSSYLGSFHRNQISGVDLRIRAAYNRVLDREEGALHVEDLHVEPNEGIERDLALFQAQFLADFPLRDVLDEPGELRPGGVDGPLAAIILPLTLKDLSIDPDQQYLAPPVQVRMWM